MPATLRRLHDLLKPGGLFISKTVCLAERGFYLRPLVALMQMVGRAPYVDFVSIADIDAAITRAGFEIGETGLYPPGAPSRFVVARKIAESPGGGGARRMPPGPTTLFKEGGLDGEVWG